jgi:uncharacterized sulfatase
MDERTDCVRSVTDGRYVYVRHYMPHRIYGQHIGYMFETPTTQVWKRLFDEGKLDAAQSAFWKEKPTGELFDLQSDPDEVTNLAASPEHREALERLIAAQHDQVLRVRDVGLLPESDIHARCKQYGVTPYELGHDDRLCPLERILDTAEAASRRGASLTPVLVARLDDADAAVRYWALTGLLVRGEGAYADASAKARARLDDTSPSVRIAAAELVGRFGPDPEAARAVAVLLSDADYQHTSEYAACAALQALDNLLTARPAAVRPHAADIAAIPLPLGKGTNPRARDYPARLKETLAERLAEPESK